MFDCEKIWKKVHSPRRTGFLLIVIIALGKREMERNLWRNLWRLEIL